MTEPRTTWGLVRYFLSVYDARYAYCRTERA